MNVYTQTLLRDDYTCLDCGSNTDLEIHHILPLSQGGLNKLINLKTVCKKCHDTNYNDVHYPKDKSKIIPHEQREKPLIALDKTREAKVSLWLTEELVDNIDDFRFDNRIPNRSEAIRNLIEKGLDK